MSILNVEVSCFPSYTSPANPKPVNLLTWLQSDKYRDRVLQLRNIQDKKERDRLKATLPAITPSGTFTRRQETGLIEHSGFICLDIDQKGNEHIGNFADLKTHLSRFLNVAYCGLSVSGTGYFVLVLLAHPGRHKEHFAALEQDFAQYGILIDTACKDVARLRGYSFDDAPFFRHDALPYVKLSEPVKRPPLNRVLKPGLNQYEITTDGEALGRVERILAKKGIQYGGTKAGHEYRMRFAWFCNLYGVSIEECKNHVFAHFPPTDGRDDFSDCYRLRQDLYGTWRR